MKNDLRTVQMACMSSLSDLPVGDDDGGKHDNKDDERGEGSAEKCDGDGKRTENDEH